MTGDGPAYAAAARQASGGYCYALSLCLLGMTAHLERGASASSVILVNPLRSTVYAVAGATPTCSTVSSA